MDRICAAPNRKRQRQKIRDHQWTVRKRERFLDLLAATGNASYAARQVGMSGWGAFALRRRDPAFAALWQSALDTAYDVLEAQLLARAMGDPAAFDPAADPAADPANAIMPGAGLTDADKAAIDANFDPKLAQDLLKRRDATGAERRQGHPPYKRVPPEELADILERQLTILRKRVGARGGA